MFIWSVAVCDNGVEVVDVDMARGKCVEGIHRPSLLRATMNSRDTR